MSTDLDTAEGVGVPTGITLVEECKEKFAEYNKAYNRSLHPWNYTTHRANPIFGTHTEDEGRIWFGHYYRIRTWTPTHTWMWWLPDQYVNYVTLPTSKNEGVSDSVAWIDKKHEEEQLMNLLTQCHNAKGAYLAAAIAAGVKPTIPPE